MIIVADLPYQGLILRQGFRRVLSALAATDADAMQQRPLPRLYGAGVTYRPEPPVPDVLRVMLGAAPGEGVEFWDSPYKAMRQGWADCDDAVRWRLAELYMSGEFAMPAAATRTEQPNRHHVLIRRQSRALEDPAMMIKNARKR